MMSLLILGTTVFPLFIALAHEPSIPLSVIVIVVILAVPAAFFLVCLATMRYELDSAVLHLRSGPFHWRISVRSIGRATVMNFEYDPWAQGWRLPGYSLFTVYYNEAGKHRMCATSSYTQILVLETDTDKWGITPRDLDGFLAALESAKKTGAPSGAPVLYRD